MTQVSHSCEWGKSRGKWEIAFWKNENLEFTQGKHSTIVGLSSLLCKYQIILDVAQASDLHKNIGAV